MVQKKNRHASHNNNKKVKPDVKPKVATNFKKKGKGKAKGDCFVCGKSGHWAKDCPERKDRKCANMVISEGGGTSGYGKILPIVLFVFHSPDWWVDTGANIHVCADISLFSSYQVRERFLLVDGKRVAYGCLWCWYGRSEVYFGKDRAAEERATCPFNKEESC
ncbi:hypothetical protein OsJ_34283 [Oryza sativa Japonica Group]|uniref:CCHC-type domain-containing protein n=1 Tax=Oryza sativa subsp. japonica TaxID=39947 RepID=B9GB85_ORYSJ|nr:hypothetical protein OsJ_34283 [Oryza sativa Japonica Group]